MGGKVVKTLVMWAFFIIPVYELGSFVDFIILNLIEFWTGSNPLAMREGQIETQIVERNGNKYEIIATRNKFEVKQLTGEKKGMIQSVTYNPQELAWYNTSNGSNEKIIQYNIENNNIATITYYGNGQELVVDANTLTRITNDVAVR